MNEAPKPTNRWKSIAIVALVVALIACGVVVYLLNRPVPETPVLTSIDRPALQAEPQAEPTAELPSALQAEPQAEPTAEPIFDVTEVPKPAEAPLSLWTDGALARDSLQAYMDMITSDGVGYIPPEDRIAVFDLDGTLFCETDPVYFDYSLLLYRVTQDEDYKDKASDFERETARKIQEMILTGKSAQGLEVDHGKCVASAFAGMTIPEFEAYCKKFRELPARGYEGMTIGEGFYRPMLQVVDYLVANDFKVYVVSGTDRLIVRGIVKDSLLKVPMEQIIGSDETLVARQQGDADGLDYVFTKGDDVVLGGEFIVKNLKMNKVTVILQEIGKQPVLSFGNSTGDASMAEFVTNNNPYPSMAFMLCCDDEVRENGSAAKAEKMAKLCAEFDWVPISMKDDWTTIYGDGVKRKATPDNVIFDIPEQTAGIDYLALVNKVSALPEGWEDALKTVTITNSVNDAVTVEQKAYDAYLKLKDDLEKNDGIYLELDSAFRSVAQQEDIMTRFIEKYGEDYATKTVAQPGYSEHHTGLALDLYFKLKNEDGTFTDVYHNEDMEKAEYAPIWEKIHSKLADYGFILRYLPGVEHITGYRHELWHIRYVDSVEIAKAIMAEPAMTLEEYLKGQRAPEAAIDLSGSALYSPEELTDAMLTVKCKFAAFAGCELHSIRYGGDEAATEENLAWLNSHKENASYTKVMKLLTNFHTDADILGAWEPDQEYTDYQWWLGFNAKGEWEIVDWGY